MSRSVLQPGVLVAALLLGGCADQAGSGAVLLEREVHQGAVDGGDPLEGHALLGGARGGRVLLLGVRREAPPDEVTARPVYLLRLSLSGRPPVQALAGDPEVLDAAISPDGTRLAAVPAQGGRLLLQGTGEPAGLRAVDADALGGLAFSSDGDRLVYTCGSQIPETDICLMDWRDGRQRRVTGWPGPDDRPGFGAPGQWIHFVSGRGGAAAIWRLDLDQAEANAKQLTNQGLGIADVSGPGFIPVPVGPDGALWADGALVYDTGDAVVAFRDGVSASVGAAGSLVLPGRRRGQVLLITLRAAKLQRTELLP